MPLSYVFLNPYDRMVCNVNHLLDKIWNDARWKENFAGRKLCRLSQILYYSEPF